MFNRYLFFALIIALLAPYGPIGQARADHPITEPAALERETLASAVSEVLILDRDPSQHGAHPGDGVPNLPGATQDWWSAVQTQIRQDAYALTSGVEGEGDSLYRGHNPAHRFKPTFGPDSLHLTPARSGSVQEGAPEPAAADEGPQWTWSLRFTGYGYGSPLPGPDGKRLQKVVAPARITAEGNRIEYHREGITEWYVNDERGLKQGFTLNAPPASASAGERLVLELALDTDLVSFVDDSPGEGERLQEIDFRLVGGNVAVLRYGELHVADATGRQLPAHLSWSQSHIRIWIDDAGAAYPLLVDPLIVTPDWEAVGENDGDHFGDTVATAGDVNGDGYADVIVGAPEWGTGGRVYVYYGSASGLSLTPDWTRDGTGDGSFGRSVGTAGDVNGDGYTDVIVGDPDYGVDDNGRAYVYTGGTSGLNLNRWIAGESVGDSFGWSVGAAGDVNGDGYADVVVGAYLNDDGDTAAGKAYVYYGSASGPAATADWTATGEAAGDWFGGAVGTAGDVNGDGYADLIFGAVNNDENGTSAGKAYVYYGSASGPGATADWTAAGEVDNDWFGEAVGTAGDVNGDGYSDLVVGAPLNSENGTSAGKVYVYHGAASGLSQMAAWTAAGEAAVDRFGWSVGAAGDVDGDGYADLVVGAHFNDENGTNAGKAYVYHGSAAGLSPAADWTASGEAAEDSFGVAVGTAGDVDGDGYADLVVGAPYHGATDRGKAYVYHGPTLGVQIEYDWAATGEAASGQFGRSASTAGDVNGDGYSDLVVGAPDHRQDGLPTGKVYVYHGGPTGLSPTAAWSAGGEGVYDGFGGAVGAAGDVNGDGYDDLVVGAYGHNDGGRIDAGKVYLYYGGPEGLGPTAAWTAVGEHAYDELGWAVAGAGDVNGDGYADLVAGAAGYPNGDRYGRAYVYYGAEDGLGTAGWVASGEAADDRFGWAVGTAGDVNGDGYADLVVGAPFNDDGGNDAGKVYVYYGSASGLGATVDWTAAGAFNRDQFGFAVGTAGDVNGDGYADLIVGAPRSSDTYYVSKAFVYHGSASGLPDAANCRLVGQVNTGARFGFAVGTAGDVNGDGYADVLVGAYGVDGLTGGLFLYHGSESGIPWETTADWTAGGERLGDQFGWAAGTAGDVNGDGYSDLVASAPGYDPPGSADAGRAYVYHGAADAPSDTAAWTKEVNSCSLNTAGDVNGDGYADVIVSDDQYDNSRGKVQVYLGSKEGLSASPDWIAIGEAEGDSLGVAVGTAGDVNGDGYADIIVGGWNSVYVYHGSAGGLSTTADWTAVGETAYDLFDMAVGTAGDVNGDGYADVIVGGPYNDDNGADAGKAYVYHGSAGGLSTTADWTAVGETAYDLFGIAVGTAGDVNGDAYADVIVGAPYNDGNGADAGKAYVYYGSASGLGATVDWTATGEAADDRFGFSLDTAGDVNGDGYADVIVGAPFNDNAAMNVGKAYVYHGSTRGLGVPFSSFVGEAANDHFGMAVGTAGDVNGDGYADVVGGAPDNDVGGADAGKAYVYRGSAEGLSTTGVYTTIGEAADDWIGWSVGTAGDANGDGYADVLIAGGNAAFLYRGNDGGGRPAHARQLRGDGSDSPVQPWGVTYTRDSFGVSLQAIHPLGRGRARLQVQACPAGAPFGSPTCLERTAADWTEVINADGVELTEIVSWLEEGTLYRWRARLLYDSPLYPHGPWRRFLGQGQEADLRAGLLATDLQISKTMTPIEEATPGEPLTYSLTFAAAGGPAVGVVITDILPGSLTNVAVITEGVALRDTGVRPGYVWEAGDMAAGQTGAITITGVASATRFLNTAVITSTSRDVNPANNVASVQTHVDGVLFVDDTAVGADDGSSWINAYVDLQHALGEAQSGDEIWVAEGTYKPTAALSRSVSFELRSGVALYGGFAGNEVYRRERNWMAHPTLLSGDIGTPGNSADNAYHVVVASGTSATAVLDGFIIAGGQADGTGDNGYGGGVYVIGGGATLRNLALIGNTASQGGGLYNKSGNPVLVNVAFSGNAADTGGGLYNADANPSLVNVTFSRNSAGAGGGLYNTGGAPALTNCILWGNEASAIGDQIHNASGMPDIAFSDIQGSGGSGDGWDDSLGSDGGGNLDADPQFVDAGGPDGIPGTLDDDLRLHTTFRYPSPVIDRGSNGALPADAEDLDGDGDLGEPLPLDLSGRSRLIGFTVVTSTVDLGAYEANILDVLAEGDALLDDGRAFRLEHLQLLPADTQAQALQNYANFNDGEWYYAFCADYDSIDDHGYCPETGPEHVRNDLLDAIDLYRVAVGWPTPVFTTHDGLALSVRALGGGGVLSATEEIANDHLIFGNEFLVDATDYRFSTAGIPYADEIIGRELDELAQAQRQFELILDLVFRAFNDWGVGDYCGNDQFETFGVASSLMMTTLDETATRYYMLGRSSDALAVYAQAERNQSLHLMALADLARTMGNDYLVNGSYEMLNNLSRMRDRATAIQDGLDFFGFAPEYAPLQSYDRLLELVEGPTGDTGLLGTARDLEDQAREAQRTFDTNASDMSTELDNLTVELSDQLFELCGESEDQDEDGFGDYDVCEGGLMAQNQAAFEAAYVRQALAWMRAQNIAREIEIEQERAGAVIQVTLGTGQELAAADLAIGKLQAYRQTRTQASSSEASLHLGIDISVEAWAEAGGKTSTSVTNNETYAAAAIKGIVRNFFTYGREWTWLDSTETTWDPNAAVIGTWESIKSLQQAEAQAEIEGANSAATVKNLLLRQSEALLEYEVAVEELNQAAAEHNHLIERHSRLLNKRAQAINRVVSHNSHLLSPAYRIWRDSLTTQSAEAHGLAAQFAYLTARASEYELLTPYPEIGDIFKARTANDIRLFLDDLKVWHQALDLPGQLNRYPYTLSVAEDIFSLTDEQLDPEGALSQEALAQKRRAAFQKALPSWIFDGDLEVVFSTSLDQQRPGGEYVFSPNIWNNRIAGSGTPLADNVGVKVNIVTSASVEAGNVEVMLIHDGQASYRNASGEEVLYDPATAAPVGYLVPDELSPAHTTVVLRPDINGQGGLANGGLVNLSVAASHWKLRIPAESWGDLDYTQIEDIEIYLDTTGRALPGQKAAAERDAARLQVGLTLEPPADERIRPTVGEGKPTGDGSIPMGIESRPLTLAIPGEVSGSYYGHIVVTSPITLGVQLLNFNLVNLDGVLSGTVSVTETALYAGSIGLHGIANGDAFTLTSDTYVTLVAGRPVTQSFQLVGQTEEEAEVLRATYTGQITNLLPEPIVVQGMFIGSRPGAPAGDGLLVETGARSIPLNGSTIVTATLIDNLMHPITQTGGLTYTVTFTADIGTVSPGTVDMVDGIALATFTAGAESGQVRIQATTGEITGQVRVEVGATYVYLPIILRNYP